MNQDKKRAPTPVSADVGVGPKTDDSAKEIFRWKLKYLCKKNGGQAKLAHFLGITPQCVSAYVSGIAGPTLDNLRNIAIYYNVSVDYLLGLSDLYFDMKRLKGEARSVMQEITSEFREECIRAYLENYDKFASAIDEITKEISAKEKE